jgi:hypothetical protein
MADAFSRNPSSSTLSGRASSPKSSASAAFRIVELDPALGWYSLDPASLPIALVAGMRR